MPSLTRTDLIAWVHHRRTLALQLELDQSVIDHHAAIAEMLQRDGELRAVIQAELANDDRDDAESLITIAEAEAHR